MRTRRIRAGRHPIALHDLREATGVPLLLLHELGGSSADWDVRPDAWPGPVFAMDFPGHGESAWLAGGGYYPELLASDADVALASIGGGVVAGAGIGAWVALLLAGTRPAEAAGALLLPGRGLDGLPAPDVDDSVRRSDDALASFEGPRDEAQGTDPMVAMLEKDVRPIDYARAFAARARRVVLAPRAEPAPPPWWTAIRSLATVDSTTAAAQDAVSLAAAVFRPAELSTDAPRR